MNRSRNEISPKHPTNFVLDTCVISELRKPQPSQRVVEWVRQQDEQRLFLSSFTLGEIRKGIDKLAESAKRRRLESWLRQDLCERFQGRILPIDEEVALIWGRLQADAERSGKKAPVIDSLIAATTLALQGCLVTRNTEDFRQSGVVLLNPWEEANLPTL